MAKYRLLIKPSAVKEIEAIPTKRARQRLVERLSRLAEDPRPPGIEKLSGQDKHRLRQGSYRILDEIKDRDLVVCVVKVGHRKGFYR